MIDVRGVTKRYGEKLAVDDLTFQVQPGVVTGFLGPNGAGKSTTMRVILGLDAPTEGFATVNGKPYRRAGGTDRDLGADAAAGVAGGGLHEPHGRVGRVPRQRRRGNVND